ncbi:hypothetical protein [Microbacterium sp. 179-I 3D3 NHS]|uniref:hypothetical protein n=1 Tax=Microbacterium sp. 179-I 3D3 NHS TaxID=3142382 RepID=UPI0039A07A1F
MARLTLPQARAAAMAYLAEHRPDHTLAPGAYADDTAAAFAHYDADLGEPAVGEGPLWVDLGSGDVELLGSIKHHERLAAMRGVR